MSTEEQSDTSSADTPAPKQPKSIRRTFTLHEKRQLIRKYDSVKDRMSLLQFTTNNGLPRRTFRNWLINRETIMKDCRNSSLTRFKQRRSDLPELDSLLFKWFTD